MGRRFQTCKSPVTACVPAVPTVEADWPSRAISPATKQGAPEIPRAATRDKDGLRHVRRAFWLPDNCEEVKIKLLTIAYVQAAGHRGVKATYVMLAGDF